jgi:hypothetical protein
VLASHYGVAHSDALGFPIDVLRAQADQLGLPQSRERSRKDQDSENRTEDVLWRRWARSASTSAGRCRQWRDRLVWNGLEHGVELLHR